MKIIALILFPILALAQDSIVFVLAGNRVTIYKDGHAKRIPSLTAATSGKYLYNLNGEYVWNALAGGGDMLKSENLSGLSNYSTARTNLGLGNITNESKSTMFTNATFTGTFDVADGAIANADLASGVTGNIGGFVREFRVKLGSDYTNATTTGTEISGLQISPTGTGLVDFEFTLLVQSSATTTGWKCGVNHTGTATVLAINMTYPSTGTTAATGVGENVVLNNTGSIYEASANTALSTTSPNLGPTAGVAATGTNVLVKVFGVLNVTVSGDLEIWCAAETTGTITVKADSYSKASTF